MLRTQLRTRAPGMRQVFQDLDPSGVPRLVAADRAGRVDAAYTIFAVLCTEIWCRLFIDRPVPGLPRR